MWNCGVSYGRACKNVRLCESHQNVIQSRSFTVERGFKDNVDLPSNQIIEKEKFNAAVKSTRHTCVRDIYLLHISPLFCLFYLDEMVIYFRNCLSYFSAGEIKFSTPLKLILQTMRNIISNLISACWSLLLTARNYHILTVFAIDNICWLMHMRISIDQENFSAVVMKTFHNFTIAKLFMAGDNKKQSRRYEIYIFFWNKVKMFYVDIEVYWTRWLWWSQPWK